METLCSAAGSDRDSDRAPCRRPAQSCGGDAGAAPATFSNPVGRARRFHANWPLVPLHPTPPHPGSHQARLQARVEVRSQAWRRSQGFEMHASSGASKAPLVRTPPNSMPLLAASPGNAQKMRTQSESPRLKDNRSAFPLQRSLPLSRLLQGVKMDPGTRSPGKDSKESRGKAQKQGGGARGEEPGAGVKGRPKEQPDTLNSFC